MSPDMAGFGFEIPPGQGTVPIELDYGSVLQLSFDKLI
jgi:hypothetical protein